MKLLFLTPQPPFPADQGTKLRNRGLIRIAAEAGHEVHLLTFAPSAPSAGEGQGEGNPAASPDGAIASAHPESGTGPQRWCSKIVLVPAPPPRSLPRRAFEAGLSRLPDLLLRLRSPAYLRALQQMLAEERYDVVQVEGLELALNLPAARGARVIFDDHNVEYLLQRRAFRTHLSQPRRAHAALYSFIQWRRLQRWEARVCRAADTVLAASERDSALLRALSGRDVVAVPNGIDLDGIPFRQPEAEGGPNLLFDGTMSFRPNDDAAIWFSRQILPLIRRNRPDVRFWVVGREPSPELVAFNFGRNGVAVTGAVPSTEPYWERAGIYVLPMRIGGGVRFKALEAMARGLPLVSTALGMEGTPARPERDYLSAERPADFAAAVLRLLDDADLRRNLAASARRTVAVHDWPRIAPRLLEVYRRPGQIPARAHGGGRE